MTANTAVIISNCCRSPST